MEFITLRVGDLCFRAVGQIVNRRLAADGGPMWFENLAKLRGQKLPEKSPMAEAARQDWSGLTAAAHERSLRDDALRLDERGLPNDHAWSAILRLLCYYPDAGREVAEAWLARAPREFEKPPLAANEIGFEEARDLVCQLRQFQWDGLDAAVLRLYRAAVARPVDNLGHRLSRDGLALECVRRLKGHGHDEEFARFFTATLAADEVQRRQPKTAYTYALGQADNDYRAMLRDLGFAAR